MYFHCSCYRRARDAGGARGTAARHGGALLPGAAAASCSQQRENILDQTKVDHGGHTASARVRFYEMRIVAFTTTRALNSLSPVWNPDHQRSNERTNERSPQLVCVLP